MRYFLCFIFVFLFTLSGLTKNNGFVPTENDDTGQQAPQLFKFPVKTDEYTPPKCKDGNKIPISIHGQCAEEDGKPVFICVELNVPKQLPPHPSDFYINYEGRKYFKERPKEPKPNDERKYLGTCTLNERGGLTDVTQLDKEPITCDSAKIKVKHSCDTTQLHKSAEYSDLITKLGAVSLTISGGGISQSCDKIAAILSTTGEIFGAFGNTCLRAVNTCFSSCGENTRECTTHKNRYEQAKEEMRRRSQQARLAQDCARKAGGKGVYKKIDPLNAFRETPDNPADSDKLEKIAEGAGDGLSASDMPTPFEDPSDMPPPGDVPSDVAAALGGSPTGAPSMGGFGGTGGFGDSSSGSEDEGEGSYLARKTEPSDSFIPPSKNTGSSGGGFFPFFGDDEPDNKGRKKDINLASGKNPEDIDLTKFLPYRRLAQSDDKNRWIFDIISDRYKKVCRRGDLRGCGKK